MVKSNDQRRTRFRDQYNNDVPDDRVVLDLTPGELTPEELDWIDQLNWYAPATEHHGQTGLILVSLGRLQDCLHGTTDGTDPADCDVEELKGVVRIPHILHRWNEEHFYHA